MSSVQPATVHIDGGSRGNPGPASYAVVLNRPGLPTIEECETIGSATNNVAEYTALVRALELAEQYGVRSLNVFSDSELLVKQMNGEYRVKSGELQELFAEAGRLRRGFDRVTLTHVRREQNKRADFLCNEALDGRPRAAGEAVTDAQPAAAKKPAAPKKPVSDAGVRADAIACLDAAAAAWASGKQVAPAMVWDQLWSILEEGGVLKKK